MVEDANAQKEEAFKMNNLNLLLAVQEIMRDGKICMTRLIELGITRHDLQIALHNHQLTFQVRTYGGIFGEEDPSTDQPTRTWLILASP